MIIKIIAAVIAVAAFFVLLLGLLANIKGTETPATSKRKSPKSDRITRAKSRAKKTGAEYANDFLAMAGEADRVSVIPGWAMLLHYPLNPPANPTSWIGGTPKAPSDFVWPSTSSGARQHFLAQIDLAALSDTANNGLPGAGALLVFFSYQWTDNQTDHVYSCHILTADEMKMAADIPVPDDLDPLNQNMGFFHPGQTFHKHGVDLVPFLDDGTSPPASLPNPFARPEHWISNWGLALAEVEIAIKQLQCHVKPLLGEQGEKYLADRHKQSEKMPGATYLLNEIKHSRALIDHGPQMLETLAAWRDLTRSKPPAERIDFDALKALFDKRAALAEQLAHYIADILMNGSHVELWRQIQPDALVKLKADKTEPEWEIYREFFDQKATGWRGHRLFGIEPPFPNNCEDRRGQDCLINIGEDTLLGTTCEHFYGISIWCPRADMANGILEGGQVVRHCAV